MEIESRTGSGCYGLATRSSINVFATDSDPIYLIICATKTMRRMRSQEPAGVTKKLLMASRTGR